MKNEQLHQDMAEEDARVQSEVLCAALSADDGEDLRSRILAIGDASRLRRYVLFMKHGLMYEKPPAKR